MKGEIMIKMTMKHGILAGMAVFAIAIIAPVAAYAQDADATEMRHTAEEHKSAMQQKVVERKEAMQTKLADAKLKACEKRQEKITNIMTRMTERAEKRVVLFDTIAERTKRFYVNKGKVLANYDALVSDVDDKKAAVQAHIDTAKSTRAAFDCNGEDPKGTVDNFKATAETGRDALKAHRTAVKNLIVGVKSVQSTTVTENGGTDEATR
jgi:hypothetical protein